MYNNISSIYHIIINVYIILLIISISNLPIQSKFIRSTDISSNEISYDTTTVSRELLSNSRSLYHRKIVLLGDSITFESFYPNGWGNLLAKYYLRNADVLNRGFNGWNSRWMLQAIQRILPSKDVWFNHDVIMVVIYLGCNDASTDGLHVPLSEYEENIIQLIEYIHNLNPHIHIILITPTDVNSGGWNTRSTALVSEYANVIRKIPQKMQSIRSRVSHRINHYHISVVDMWKDKLKIEFSDLSDGLHLNNNGNLKVFNGIQDVISKHDTLKADRQYLPTYEELRNNTIKVSKQLIDVW